MTTAAVVIYFFFLAFIFIALPVFLPAFWRLSFLVFVRTSSFRYLPFLLRADIALALERASAFDEAPQSL
jgi:hypothetical protein